LKTEKFQLLYETKKSREELPSSLDLIFLTIFL